MKIQAHPEVRVLLCLHHRLDPDAGAPGATLELGRALEEADCAVDYYGYEQAFRGVGSESAAYRLRFPWQLARFLGRRARGFDVIDCTTGDAWVWAACGRPGAARGTALVTRSHGLEHVSDERERGAARRYGEPLSWKHPLYHGGFRL